MEFVSKIYLWLLLLGSVVMLIWGVAGFFEYFTGTEPFIKLQNDVYPGGLQFVHWFLISTTGSVFFFGYLLKWKWTPYVMVLLFSNLAVMCTIQTFDFMSEQWGYSQYFIEVIMYIVNSLFLVVSPISKIRFGH